jgi:hypothetical protein
VSPNEAVTFLPGRIVTSAFNVFLKADVPVDKVRNVSHYIFLLKILEISTNPPDIIRKTQSFPELFIPN